MELAHDMESLWQLDVIDRELDQLRAEQARTPQELAVEVEVLAELDATIASTEAALAAARKAQAEAETELQELETRTARAHNRMAALTTAEQIESTQREVIRLGELASDAETAILVAMDDGEVAAALLADQKQQRARASGVHEGRKAAWASRGPELSARIGDLEARSEPIKDSLRNDVLARYIIARKMPINPRGGVTWTALDFHCYTCKRTVPARWVKEAREQVAWHTCDMCKRVLLPQAASLEPEPPAQPEEPAPGA